MISAGLGAAERVPDRSMVSVDRSPRLWQGTVLSGPIRASGGPVRKLFGWRNPKAVWKTLGLRPNSINMIVFMF